MDATNATIDATEEVAVVPGATMAGIASMTRKGQLEAKIIINLLRLARWTPLRL